MCKVFFAFILLIFSYHLFASDCFIQIDSITNVEISNIDQLKEYILYSSNSKIEDDDLLFNEFSLYIHKALRNRNFISAKNIKEANVIIYLSYGIGNPQEFIGTYFVPIFTTPERKEGDYPSIRLPEIIGHSERIETVQTYNRFMKLNCFFFKRTKENMEYNSYKSW